MKRYNTQFNLLFITVFLLNTSLFAIGPISLKVSKVNCDVLGWVNHAATAVAPPVVKSPVYYCQGSTAVPLTATPSSGNTLRWYTVATGGTFTSTAPTPATATVGSISYYVSETDGVLESSRVQIVVNVVADNGSKILLFRCDPSHIAAADKNSSVFFDWSNTAGLPNQYNYSYTIDGGAPIFGTTAPSNLQVFGLLPGQSVTLTLEHTTYPCDRSVLTCSVPCGTATTTPNFSPIPPFCTLGETLKRPR